MAAYYVWEMHLLTRRQRALLSQKALAKEYTKADISSFPATGTTNPADATNPHTIKITPHCTKMHFADWSLQVEGSVSKPGAYSLGDLQKFPSRTQITRHTCEEGWTAIAEWTGVQLVRIVADCRHSAKSTFCKLLLLRWLYRQC
jgi:DMSO/TMAO reductase YedYZ molybdopterin-dependent catalytic subunit